MKKELDTIAGMISNGVGYDEMIKMLYNAFLEHHGLEDLHFFGDDSWFYCSDTKPTQYEMCRRYDMKPSDKLRRLCYLASNDGWGKVMYWGDGGHSFDNIEDVKRHHLTKKLAGI